MSIKIENTEVVGWESAIRGMRNPLNSWDKSDSGLVNADELPEYPNKYIKSTVNRYLQNEFNIIGPNDHKLMMNLAKAGTSHSKYRRMITVYVDITAPLYWWKEFDTYKVGTVANSCSTMHKLTHKEFEFSDFSYEHLFNVTHDISTPTVNGIHCASTGILEHTINALNFYRKLYLETGLKPYWWQILQLLPSSYNQKRTVMLNYEVLANIYETRKDHKLDEWHDLGDWIKTLPYSELITGEVVDDETSEKN